MYYLYLALTRSALDVFLCNAPAIPDGTKVGRLVADPNLKCFEDAAHIRVFIIGCICFLVYGILYPVLVFRTLKKNKKKVKTDQILRAMDIGDTVSTNPYLSFRIKFHKLYYHFKPGKWYWICVVIARKFGIAITALMFRNTPSFQMAICLCVLFFAYVLQVRHTPYMSMAEKRAVILAHKEKVAQKHELHLRIAQAYERAMRNAKEAKARRIVNIDQLLQQGEDMKRMFLFDYNTLESVLLFCGCLVCLCGVMFQAGKLNDLAYEANRNILAVLMIMLVSASLLYFFLVFTTEVMSTFGCIRAGELPFGLERCLNRKKEKTTGNVLKQQQQLNVEMDEDDMDGGMQVNPYVLQQQQMEAVKEDVDALLNTVQPPSIQHWQIIKARYSEFQSNIQGLQAAIRENQDKGGKSSPAARAEAASTPSMHASPKSARVKRMSMSPPSQADTEIEMSTISPIHQARSMRKLQSGTDPN
jgi:hypothetical protein